LYTPGRDIAYGVGDVRISVVLVLLFPEEVGGEALTLNGGALPPLRTLFHAVYLSQRGQTVPHTAQGADCQFPTPAARVWSEVAPCWICGERSVSAAL
jgi:hypothetical protein